MFVFSLCAAPEAVFSVFFSPLRCTTGELQKAAYMYLFLKNSLFEVVHSTKRIYIDFVVCVAFRLQSSLFHNTVHYNPFVGNEVSDIKVDL